MRIAYVKWRDSSFLNSEQPMACAVAQKVIVFESAGILVRQDEFALTLVMDSSDVGQARKTEVIPRENVLDFKIVYDSDAKGET